MRKSMYIHIPFCDQICSYCDFSKMYTHNKLVEPYLQSLLSEIHEKYRGEVLDTLYFGGGTPSALSLHQLKVLFDGLSILNLSDDCEVTFEANPENLTEEKIVFLKNNRVNRVSLGAQTFHEHHLSFLNRGHKGSDVLRVVGLLLKHGIENINLDLMFGFPGETLEEVRSDLKSFLALNIPHISMYSLIIESHTLIQINGVRGLEDDLEAEMYETIIQTLTESGYRHYEISNFSKMGFESRHNLAYWKSESYYGFGLGAHGYLDGMRYENTRSITRYNEGVFMKSSHQLSKLEMMQEYFFLGLRMTDGISLSVFRERFGVEPFTLFEIQEKIQEYLLEQKGDFLRLTPKGQLLGNEVFEIFV